MLFPEDQASSKAAWNQSGAPEGPLGMALLGSCSILAYIHRQEALGEMSDRGGSKHCEPWHLSSQSPELLAICFQLSSFMVDFLSLSKSYL